MSHILPKRSFEAYCNKGKLSPSLTKYGDNNVTNLSSIPTLLNEHQAAEILNIKATTLRRWRWEGRGPQFRKIGSAVRYQPDDISSFIESASRQNTCR